MLQLLIMQPANAAEGRQWAAMASVRKRTWTTGGKVKTAWVVDYFDQHGKRRLKN